MSREIKFRGRRIDVADYGWVYGFLVIDAAVDNLHNIVINLGEESYDWIEVDPDTVGQSTGLKDKNGKEIYEGDIVRSANQNNIIEYQYGSFMLIGLHEDRYERNYSHLHHHLIDATIGKLEGSNFDGITTCLEVIGSIHEHPHLLKENEVVAGC